MAPKQVRSRYKGEDGPLEAVIKDALVNPQAVWYSLSGKRQPTWLVRHAKVLRALAALQPNLSFEKVQLKRVIEKVILDKKWFDDPEEANQFIDTMAARFRTMCRDLEQAQIKKSRAMVLANRS